MGSVLLKSIIVYFLCLKTVTMPTVKIQIHQRIVMIYLSKR